MNQNQKILYLLKIQLKIISIIKNGKIQKLIKMKILIIITKWKILYLNSEKNLRNIEKMFLNKKEINKKLMNKIIDNDNE